MKSDFKKIKGTLRGEIKQLKKRIPDISIDKDSMEYTHRREVEKLKASVQKATDNESHCWEESCTGYKEQKEAGKTSKWPASQN